jgi:hypothetical protein
MRLKRSVAEVSFAEDTQRGGGNAKALLKLPKKNLQTSRPTAHLPRHRSSHLNFTGSAPLNISYPKFMVTQQEEVRIFFLRTSKKTSADLRLFAYPPRHLEFGYEILSRALPLNLK